jgi:hypothetical protein
MYNYIALVLLLTTSTFGQMARGNAGSRFSGLHNHWAIPIDGGQVAAWGMHNPGTTDCIITANQIHNDAYFTGSGDSTSKAQCGGANAPTIGAQGLVTTGSAAVVTSTNAIFRPNAYTAMSTFLPTSISGEQFCGITNTHGNPGVYQYLLEISRPTNGKFDLYYDPTGSNTQVFSSTSAPISTNTWQVITSQYISATPSSAELWYNHSKVAGSWTTGDGTPAIPANNIGSDLTLMDGGNGFNAGCIGTIGYIAIWDHSVSYVVHGFIYNAMYRAMQFRQVALP